MQKLLLLMFIFLVCGFSHANNPPVIHSVSANPTTITAGMYVSFDVIASDADKDVLTYEWDFNDGTKSSEKSVKHVFDFNGTKKKTFNVKITVSDGKAEATKEIPIEVEPAFLKLKVISPLHEDTFSKGSNLSVKVAVLDKLLQPVANYKTYYVTATIGEQTFDLEAIGEGVWGAEIKIPYKAQNEEYVILEASAFAEGEPRYTNSAVKILLKPISLRAELRTNPDVLIVGSELNSIILEVTYPDGSKVENAEIDATLAGKKIPFTYRDGRYVASSLGFLVEKEKLLFSADIKDKYGNELKDFRRLIKAKKIALPEEKPEKPVEEKKPEVAKPKEKMEEKLTEELLVFLQQNIIWVGAGIFVVVIIIAIAVFFLRKKKPAKEFKIDEKKLKQRIEAAYTSLSTIIPKNLTAVEKLKRLEEKINRRQMAVSRYGEKLTPQEEKAVEHLVKLLMPHKDKYNRKELEAAVMAEGYSRKIAKIVAKRIYG